MKFYEFVDKIAPIADLVVVEGNEAVLAQRAIELVIERVLPEADRSLNLDILDATATEDVPRAVASAVAAMPFLAERRVVVVRGCERLRVGPRRDLWKAVQAAPGGNVLVLEDLNATAKKAPTKAAKGKAKAKDDEPDAAGPFATLAGSKALRIDTQIGPPERARFVRDALVSAGGTADAAVVAALSRGSGDLGAIASDLSRLALLGRPITIEDLQPESLGIEDPVAWKYSAAMLDGRPAEALAVAFDLFADSSRDALIPLVSALARDLGMIWEIARPGGGAGIAPRDRWRVAKMSALARRIGERRARYGYETAVRAFEALVTGRIDDPRAAIEILTADIAAKVVGPAYR